MDLYPNMQLFFAITLTMLQIIGFLLVKIWEASISIQISRRP